MQRIHEVTAMKTEVELHEELCSSWREKGDDRDSVIRDGRRDKEDTMDQRRGDKRIISMAK